MVTIEALKSSETQQRHVRLSVGASLSHAQSFLMASSHHYSPPLDFGYAHVYPQRPGLTLAEELSLPPEVRGLLLRDGRSPRSAPDRDC